MLKVFGFVCVLLLWVFWFVCLFFWGVVFFFFLTDLHERKHPRTEMKKGIKTEVIKYF